MPRTRRLPAAGDRRRRAGADGRDRGLCLSQHQVLNRYETSDEAEKFSADYETKYLKYESLPQPAITKVTLDVQLYPKAADARRRRPLRRYATTPTLPIREVHVRQGDRDIEWLKLDIAGARLVVDDKKFGYRIYRFDAPLAPGATRQPSTFSSRVWRRGFRAGRSGDRHHRERHLRQQYRLRAGDRHGPARPAQRPHQAPPPGPSGRAASRPSSRTCARRARNYVDADWVMSDITLTTDADQTPIAPGNRVSDVTADGRRTARFVSTGADPQLLLDPVGATTRSRARDHNGIKLSVYYHPGPRLERRRRC